jgi:hypothetical protein
MKTFRIALAFVLFFLATDLSAQQKLTVDKVYAAYLRNSGAIMENNQIKGYFFLYQSDKIDYTRNAYTLQVLDENLNKVRDIKFEDSKDISLLEAAYNGNTLAFLFQNKDLKTLDMKVYGLDGKLKYTYSREYDRKTAELMNQYKTMHTDEGTNQNVHSLGDGGYASILPVREGKMRTYQVEYFSSLQKKQWSYTPDEEEERYSFAEFLGSTDSLILLEVLKKNRALSGKMSSHFIGINYVTRKKMFDLANENDEYNFVPSTVIPVEGKGEMLLIGSYYDKDDNVAKDFSKGLAFYTINSKGKIVSKAYNSWEGDMSKYLSLNAKGKVENFGYMYIHKVIYNGNGKYFVVGEGYKRQASAGGIALTALGMMAGHYGGPGVTKIVVTDMIVMEMNDKFKINGAKIFEKTQNNAIASSASDYSSQHMLAMYMKMNGSFDYEFTTGEPLSDNFSICYSDWVRTGEYKGKTFNSIRYNGTKFVEDKIELKSKATSTKVFPGKPGSVMIMEYFRKDKKLDFRLEKIG